MIVLSSFLFYKFSFVIMKNIKHQIDRCCFVFPEMDSVFWNETLHCSLLWFLYVCGCFFHPRSVSLQMFFWESLAKQTHSLRLQTFRFDCLRFMSLSTGCHFPKRCHCSLFGCCFFSSSISITLGFLKISSQFLLSYLQTWSHRRRLMDGADMWQKCKKYNKINVLKILRMDAGITLDFYDGLPLSTYLCRQVSTSTMQEVNKW